MIEERFDLVDLDGKLLGRTIARGERLPTGEYHHIIQVWVRNAEGDYLIQRRSDAKPTLPGLWATTAGAVHAGETTRIGAARELAEEMGIVVDPNELQFVFRDIFRQSISHVWLLEREVSLSDLTLQEEEVSEAMWVSAEKIRQMIVAGTFYDYGDHYFQQLF